MDVTIAFEGFQEMGRASRAGGSLGGGERCRGDAGRIRLWWLCGKEGCGRLL